MTSACRRSAASGWAGVRTKVLPALVGWIGIVAGVASVLTVLTAGTPLSALGEAAYLPSLVLAIAYRTWTGGHLWRADHRAVLSG